MQRITQLKIDPVRSHGEHRRNSMTNALIWGDLEHSLASCLTKTDHPIAWHRFVCAAQFSHNHQLVARNAFVRMYAKVMSKYVPRAAVLRWLPGSPLECVVRSRQIVGYRGRDGGTLSV